MKIKSKNNIRIRTMQYLLIGGILIMLTLIISPNLAMIPRNSPLTNSVLPNVSDSQIPTMYPITPNPSTSGAIQLSWSAVSDAQSYNVYESGSPITETNITNGQYDNIYTAYPSQTQYWVWPWVTFTDYEPNGNYYYVVTAVDSNNVESVCSNYQSVTVAASTPAASTLAAISPNPSTTPAISLYWTPVSNATDYVVLESDSPINDGNVFSANFITDVNAPQTSYTDYEYSNGTYYYVIVAENVMDYSLSNCQSVNVTLYSLAAPTLSSITPSTSSTGEITLSWNAVSGAQSYYIYESTSPLTEDNITNYQYDNCFWSSTTTYTDYESNGNYYYVVTAANNYGEGNCSNDESITVAATAPTTAPVLASISPDPTNSSAISLSWTPVNNALFYYVYESASPITSANIGSLTPINSGYPVYAPDTSFTDFENMNGTYYYAIVAANEGGISAPSNDEAVAVILHIPPAPILSSINPNPTVGDITLSWSPVSSANYYNVYVSTSPLTETNITNGQYNDSFQAYSTTYTDIESNGNYYYVVTTVDYNDLESICSNSLSVTVSTSARPTQTPTLAAISPNPSNSPYIFLSWNAVSNAAGYGIFESIYPITNLTITNLSPIGYVTGSKTKYTDQEWTNGTFYYMIVAFNAAGPSNPSNSQSVKTDIKPVTASTYVGVKAGDVYYYDYSMQILGFHDSGLMVVTVDNVTASPYSPYEIEIGAHDVMTNSTNSTTYYDDEYIGAFDYATTDYDSFFINKNISDKTFDYTDLSGDTTSETWDNNGVELTDYENGAGYSYTLTRILTPSAPTNLIITPNPSKDGNVTLQWNASAGATSYKIYRYNSTITEINSSLTLVATINATTYNDTLNESATYYYVVVASNVAGNSIISNCANVTVKLGGIPGFPLGIFLALSVFGVGIVILRKKSRIKFT